MAITKLYTIDQFLGLNEAADSYSELKQGEASRILNFDITDGGNLSTRSGFARLPFLADTQGILTMWTGFIGAQAYLISVDMANDTDRITVARVDKAVLTQEAQVTGRLALTSPNAVVKIFPFGQRVYLMSEDADLCVSADPGIRIEDCAAYIPTVITGASPSGGGQIFENSNLLTGKRAILYSADGEAMNYVLPAEAASVISAQTDAGELSFSYDADAHTVTFSQPPEKGVANLRIVYAVSDSEAAAARRQVTAMPFWEAYNGTTDTRLFFYGDGSNRTLYTGVTGDGAPSALYVPAMNEVAVDYSAAPITAMIRLYNKLMVYKPDGASFITYEPVTLPDGDVIAGFYLRTASRSLGCDLPGQVQLVNNYPRTIFGGAVYEWRASSTAYNDERYAKPVSQRVTRTLSQAGRELVSCDDNTTHSWYLFLNDEKGTILVNRYQLDVWTTYRSPLAVGVRQAMVCDGVLFFRTDTGLYCLQEGARYDTDGETQHSIQSLWESGYMSFGQNFRRKFSTYLWLTVKPESGSSVTLTAASDRKSVYAEKTLRSELFDYGSVNYGAWSYHIASLLTARRLKLKVKKVVFYKLIIRSHEPGSRATVLRIDQQVRFASLVK